jgi:hypothetical protein
MPAKLRPRTSANLLRTELLPTFLGPAPHLRYANLEFGTPDARKRARILIEGLAPSDWTAERTFRYLEKHQQDFRRCLEWLSTGSNASFDEPHGNSDEFREVRIRDKWEQQSEVRFLQQHGLDHGKIVIQPFSQDGSYLSGLALSQKSQRDPLDPLCGYLLSLLMWNGTVGVRQCKHGKCYKFFNPPTARKIFCSNRCRANAHVEMKSSEEKRNYMRKYRATLKARHRAKKLKPK